MSLVVMVRYLRQTWEEVCKIALIESEEYASRFTAFNMMVQMLEEKYACTIIDSYTHELDQVGRSKCHLIDSDAKRTIRCVVVERNGHVNYLLEVDVTGLSKWISTKMYTAD